MGLHVVGCEGQKKRIARNKIEQADCTQMEDALVLIWQMVGSWRCVMKRWVLLSMIMNRRSFTAPYLCRVCARKHQEQGALMFTCDFVSLEHSHCC